MRSSASIFCLCSFLIAVLLCATFLSADEPEKSLLEAGQKKLKAMKYNPVGVYSKGEKAGTIQLIDGTIADAKETVAIFDGATLTDGKWDLRNGDVFFNVGKSTKVKVGNNELKQGECVLFKDKKFTRLNLIITPK